MKTFFFLSLTLPIFAQGPLDPPPGAPEPSMKTLDQIESRTPISSLPFTIDTAGSYYLTANLSTTGDGIHITASNVTLDLNGFQLEGTGSGPNIEGIKAEGPAGSPLVGLNISNGIITGFGNSIEFFRVNGSSVKDVHCSGSSEPGIYLAGASGGCDGNSFSHCHVSNSASYGIQLFGVAGQCDGNSFSHCQVSKSGDVGIRFSGGLGSCSGNSVTHCLINDSASSGIHLAGGTGGKANGNVIANNIVRNGNLTPTTTSVYGIRLSNAETNRIEGNHISIISAQASAPTYGISCTSSTLENLIIKNSCFGADDSFDLSSDNTYGPEITLSGEITNTSPWANFSR